jgi:Zn-dependent M28 family amino/carboxypeptidase
VQKGIPEICLRDSLFHSGDSLLKVKLRAREKELKAWNVKGMVMGTQYPDSFLVLCAHYDHLGSFGRRAWFPGANDNASGVAMLLELANSLARKPLRYSVLFVAFSGEEAGLLGSSFMAENPPVPLSNIRFLFNLDLLGFGEKGATVVNATLHPKEFARLQEVNEGCHCLPEIKSRGKAANSDHYPFSEKGVPAFFMYLMGGPGHYHDVQDTPETLSLKGFRGTYRLLMDFLTGF